MQPFATNQHPTAQGRERSASASDRGPNASSAASLGLCMAQRAFAGLIDERRPPETAGVRSFRLAQWRIAARRTLSALSADDRMQLARWLARLFATHPAGSRAATRRRVSRVDAMLAKVIDAMAAR